MISLLLVLLAMLPFSSAWLVYSLYGRSRVTTWFMFLMTFITLWQFGFAVIYSPFLPANTAVILLRIFRAGQIFAIPTLLGFTRVLFKSEVNFSQGYNSWLRKVFFGKVFLLSMFTVATLVYFINLVFPDIVGVDMVNFDNVWLYSLLYSKDTVIYRTYLDTFVLVIVPSVYYARKIRSKIIRSTVSSMNLTLISMFAVGLLTLVSRSFYILNSVVTLLFSLYVIWTFVRMYNEALIEHNKQIARKSKLEFTGNMTSSMIHEFKNVLTSVSGSAQAISMGISSDALVDNIVKGSAHMQKLVENYQKFIKEGDMNPDMEYGKINDIITGAMGLIQTYTDSLGVKVIFESDKSIYGYVNEPTFMQVIVNLVKNGAEAIPVEVREKSVRVILTDVNDSFAVDVIDTGNGIGRDKWETIFQEFNTTKENGTGLGLPFCLKTAIAHGGRIYVVGSSPKGTHIRVAIPKYRVDHMLSLGASIGG